MKTISNQRAVIYVRVSTKEQVDEGNSLSTQEKICREYCIKNSYEVADIFVEQGESAKTANRTELQKLFNYCSDKKNDISTVVIYKLDRLSRSTDDYSYIRLLLRKYGVEIKSTSENFEDTPVGRFMENTLANIAQFDNDIRAERSAGGMRDAMRDGRYVWMAPVGYNNVKIDGRHTIEMDPISGPLIAKTFELISTNIYLLEEVRKIMTKEGLVTRSGRTLSKSYFYHLLRNELYTGWISKFGERHKGSFIPVVSEELFSQAQKVLDGRSRKNSGYLTDNPDFPLRKFIENEEGKKITGSWSKGRNKKYPFYRFANNKNSFSRDKFEENFMKFMDKYSFDDSKLEKLKVLIEENLIKATKDQRKEGERLNNRLKDLTEKQSVIIKKNLDGVISDDVLKKQLEMIEEELLKTKISLSVTPDTDTDFEGMIDFLKEYLKKPSAMWKDMELDTKVKLQWFQFPSGVTFQNNIFGTAKVSSIFKTKEAFLPTQSYRVLSVGIEPTS
ncbi:MAG: recombinase family protein [Candidatus Pacebacteria bacterium]|nr:recombinase family protein [Candidatus Paceibacterota bacterium]